MSYLVNPVKATCMKYAKSPTNGIQGYNDTCFGICAAFSGTYDTYAMDPQCSKACENLIEQKKHELYGVGSCDHQVPYRPVFWGQVPHYVPVLLKRGETPENSLNKCLKLCETSNLVQECRDACVVDFNAVEPFESKGKEEEKPQKKEEKEREEKNDNNTIIGIVILIFVILVALSVFLRK